MATVITTTARHYSDLDLNFIIHPIRKDVNRYVGELAVINSLKNLIMTNFYERPFQPELGCNIRRLLFENVDSIVTTAIDKEIRQTIANYEPRVNLIALAIQPNYDANYYSVTLEFSVLNLSTPITITFQLERLR